MPETTRSGRNDNPVFHAQITVSAGYPCTAMDGYPLAVSVFDVTSEPALAGVVSSPPTLIGERSNHGHLCVRQGPKTLHHCVDTRTPTPSSLVTMIVRTRWPEGRAVLVVELPDEDEPQAVASNPTPKRRTAGLLHDFVNTAVDLAFPV